MPEGPEVLIISEQLDFYLCNRIITEFNIIGGRYMNHDVPKGYNNFIDLLPLTISYVECKGKLIIFHVIAIQITQRFHYSFLFGFIFLNLLVIKVRSDSAI